MTSYIIQDDPEMIKSVYTRNSCAEKIQLENVLAKCYETASTKLYCKVVNSGMAAITTSIESVIMSNPADLINIIYCSECYCETSTIFCTIQQMHTSHNITVNPVNITDDVTITNLIAQFRDEVNILFVESCTNPNGFVMNFEIVPILRSLCKKLYFIVDNTFTSHIIFNPFVVGADIVVSSATKYYSAATNIAGILITNSHDLDNKFVEWQKFVGSHVSPVICKNILNEITNIDDRMVKSFVSTLAVVDVIKVHPVVDLVHYLYCQSHPSHNLAMKYFNNNVGTSIITFDVNMSQMQFKQFLTELKTKHIIRHEECVVPHTSYGHSYTTLDPHPTYIERENKNFVRYRIYVGYEQITNKCCTLVNNLLDMITSYVTEI
jgi:cystathionine beta-lyase/cystathionine gamma-synthase